MGADEQLTERKLLHGWPSAARVKIRLARAEDLPGIRATVALADVDLDPDIGETVRDGMIGIALRAGTNGGRAAFHLVMAEQFTLTPNTPFAAYLRASLVLVAEHRDHGIVGALVAYPPAGIAATAVDHVQDRKQKNKMLMLGGIGPVKIQAVAVADTARGLGIGGSLLKRCKQIYTRCGYVALYGQMPLESGLETFYRRQGFDVLDVDQGLDLWPIFGVTVHVHANGLERMFVRQRDRNGEYVATTTYRLELGH